MSVHNFILKIFQQILTDVLSEVRVNNDDGSIFVNNNEKLGVLLGTKADELVTYFKKQGLQPLGVGYEMGYKEGLTAGLSEINKASTKIRQKLMKK